ncbi:MAG TPA: S8 family serine peptidase [Pseudonocardiaceae bacterium]|nr:S8 family serine peptidase [Pseudonocardiaceae bacterium]
MLGHRPAARRGALLAVSTALIAATIVATGTAATAATNPTPVPPPTSVFTGTSALGGNWKLATPPTTATAPPTGKPATANTAKAQPEDVLAILSDATSVTGAPLAGGARSALTTNLAVNSAFSSVAADSVTPLFGQLPADQTQALTAGERSRLGSTAPDLSKIVVIHLRGGDPTAAAKALSATPGVLYAEPDQTVSTMDTTPTALPAWAAAIPQHQPSPPSSPTLPDNYGLTSSLSTFLNAGGVDAMGAYSELRNGYGQLPGTGEVITNVSIGDLTDQGMADAGDAYVQSEGPTTIVKNGQRYLDLPSLPLIPTYTASSAGTLDPTGSTEQQDPWLGEVMLDFGVMAPLPHDQQRAGAVGSGATDLLGIAPGAQYRLVVPQQPTFDQIAVALLAAARQNPRPNVITASLGYGTDTIGFPGRYLEDDPVTQAVIAAIVQEYHIVVSISANDGTRLYTPAAVGPDGGSTPTDVTRDPGATTTIDDDQYSTTPSEVLDSGAIAVGGTTLDDTLAVPPQNGGAASTNGTFAATRTDGGGDFSSGFGSRIDVSAPSDGIAAFEHPQGGTAEDVLPVLNGGTSASAPEVAAAAAVALQAARLAGRSMNPDQVRTLLEQTGRPVATPPQIDQPLQVGNQVDVTAAVNAVLGSAVARKQPTPKIARLSVAHRVTVGNLGGNYVEATDPSLIDLAGPSGTGEGLVGPVTIGADVTGLPTGATPQYVLVVGRKQFTSAVPDVRLTPTQLLQAAGLPVVSTANRTVQVTFQVKEGGRVVASAQQPLTFSATDGTFAEAPAPVAPATVAAGRSVSVHYDLTGVKSVNAPELVVSTVGHWNPALAPVFTAAYTVALTGTTGTVTVPASAFDGGGGIYGIGLVQDSTSSSFAGPVYGEFASIRVTGSTAAARPIAPTLATKGNAQFGHVLEINRATPGFSLRYDVHGVPGAAGAAVEVSAPAPTIYNALNTVTNANGTTRDNDGVDSGATAYQRLSGTSGTAALNAVTLGLTDSVEYNVRVFATDRSGKILGQASPTSLLAFDGGLAPDGGYVASLGVQGSGVSLVAVRDPDGSESVRGYQPSTGTYGATLTADPSPTSGYEVLGTDGTAKRALLLHWTATGWSLETYNTSTNTEVNSVSAADQYTVLGGRVDPTRHRAAILARRTSDNTDMVLTVDLTTGTLGTPIVADAPGVSPSTYGLIDINTATGTVYLSRISSSLICFAGGIASVASVDLDTGTVTPSASSDGCAIQIGDDSGNNQLYQMSYRSFSVNIVGTTNLLPVDGDTLAGGTAIAVRQEAPVGLAIDPVHNLGLVAFNAPQGIAQFGNVNGRITNNNATGEIAVIDLTTGKTVSTVTGLGFATGLNSIEYDIYNQHRIELDPATRTGWTFSGDNVQVQEFKY